MTKKKDEDDLLGFREFMEGEDDRFLKRAPQKKRSQEDFELVTFLEQESQRISNHIETFEEKVYVIKNYSQFPILTIEAESENMQIRRDTIELCSRESSPLFKNLDELYQQFFK